MHGGPNKHSIITNVENPETKGIEWNKSPFVMTSEVVLIHSDLNIRHMYICDYLCIYIYITLHVCIYIYTYIYIYIHIYIHHIGKKTFGKKDKIPPSTKKNTPQTHAETPRAPELSVESGISFPQKTFRTGWNKQVVNIITKPPGDGLTYPTKREVWKIIDSKCEFWGDMFSFLEGKPPPQKKMFQLHDTEENRGAQLFPSFRCPISSSFSPKW